MSVSGTNQGIRPGVCLSTTKPASPFVGQVIYMSDTDETAVWDGIAWEGLNRSRDRNAIINGDMSIDQRKSATTAITAATGFVTDRWLVENGCDAVLSSQQTTDVPTGQGFKNSLRVTATTGDATMGTTQFSVISQHIEGLNFARFAFGSSAAKPVVVSFWVKASVTGTYSFTIYNQGASRIFPSSYSISSSNTWEKKIVTIPGETTGTWLTTNGRGATINFYMSLGSNYIGTANQWNSSSIYGVTGQANAVGTSSNTFFVTGVQLEAGTVATPFEFEEYGTTLRKCQRYCFLVADSIGTVADRLIGVGTYTQAGRFDVAIHLPVTMRTEPALVAPSASNSFYAASNTTDFFDSLSIAGANSSQIAHVFNNAQVSSTAGYSGLCHLQTDNAVVLLTAEL